MNAQFAIVSGFMCCPRDDEAIEKGVPGMRFFGFALAHYYAAGNSHQPGGTDLMRAFRAASPDGLIQGSYGCIGSPNTIRERLLAYEEAGIDQIIFVAQAGLTRHEDIMSSLRLFARELLPEFKERDREHLRRRQEWLQAPAQKR